MENRPKSKCKLCGQLVANCGMKQHLQSHESSNFKKIRHPVYHLDHDDLFCKFCGKELKNRNALCQHEMRCPKNSKRLSDTGKYLTKYVLENLKGHTKFDCYSIQKQSETMMKKYASGWISPNKGQSKHEVICIHKEHNNNELNLWLDFVNHRIQKIGLPKYTTSILSDGYILVQNVYKRVGSSVLITYEHVYLMKHILGDNYTDNCVVHHIDSNKSNNSLENLMVFSSSKDHLRFHYSKYAYLIYDAETHLFSCVNIYE